MGNKTNVRYVRTNYSNVMNPVECRLTYEIDINRYPLNNIQVSSNLIEKVSRELNCSYIKYDKRSNYPTTVAFTVTAQADCDNDQDKYDRVIGERIALTRAQAKAFEKTCKFYDKIAYYVDDALCNMVSIIDNSWGAANKCWKHAKEIGNY